MDLVEAEDHFVLKAGLPDLGEATSRSRSRTARSRSPASFNRSLTLPDGVDPDAISAEFDRGVLSVRIPKPEERKPRRVSIKAGSGNGNGGAPAVEGTATES